MKTNTPTSDQIYDLFLSKMRDAYDLVFTDYRDDFEGSFAEIEECITEGNADWFYDNADSWFGQSEYESSKYEADSIKMSLSKSIQS